MVNLNWKQVEFENIATLRKEQWNESGVVRCIDLDCIQKNSGHIIHTNELTDNLNTKNKFLKGDVLFGKLRPYLRKYALPLFNGVCSGEIWVLKVKKELCLSSFLFLLVQSDKFLSQASISSGTRMPRAEWSIVSSTLFDLPPIEEQRRIVEVLECWDKGIELVKKLIEQKELQKKYLMQQLLSGALRLNGFTDKWKKCGFKELFVSVKGTTSMQIQSSEYLSNGEFPIVDQGQEQIVGFSNQKNKLYKDLPVIVFGDHTRIIKYIDFPFIIGADGTKLLKVNLAYNIRFLYYILLNAPIPNLGYSRHLSLLKQMFFYIPEKRQEQQAIAEVLSSADKEIDLLKQKLAKLEAQKKGLMQVLLTGKIRLK